MSKIIENYFETTKSMSDLWNKFYEDPQNIWVKMNEGFKVYQDLYKLWNKITDQTALDSKTVLKIYNEWQDQYSDYMKKTYIPNLPEYMRDITAKYTDMTETYRGAMNTFWKPWIENEADMKEKLFSSFLNDPQAYLDYLNIIQKNYDESFSKLMTHPMFGKDRESLELQRKSFDKYIKFSISLNEFNTRIYQIYLDATKQVMDDYVKMYTEGTQPKTFEEFYKYWASQVNNAYDKIFFSDDFSKLVGHTVEAMTKFKKEADKVFEDFLRYVPVPKQSEMDSLYKNVYELKKEIRTLKADINSLKKQTASE